MATAKKSNKKAAATTTFAKIKEVAKVVNTEVQATAKVVAEEVKENRTKVTKVTSKVDFNDSTAKIKDAAKTINTQVKDVAVEAMDKVVANGKQLSATATKRVKDAVAKIDVAAGVKTATTTVKAVNEYSLKTADELLDGAKANSEKWSKVASKAVKGGLDLAGKQQDLVFDALETVKKQLTKNAFRAIEILTKK